MGKVITVANMKGGVGKTATVVGLAEALAADDLDISVLVIDLDAQANASSCLAGDGPLADLIRDGRTIDGFLKDRILDSKSNGLEKYIREYVSSVRQGSSQLGIALLASSVELRRTELDMLYRLTKTKMSLDEIVAKLSSIMSVEFGKLRRKFDYVIVDCGPGISILTEVTIRLSDMVIVPTIPDALSTYGLQAFCNSLWVGEIAKTSYFGKKPKVKRPHVLITRRRQLALHSKYVDEIRGEEASSRPSFHVYKVEVPECVDIPKGLEQVGNPLPFGQKWGPRVVSVMRDLVNETKEALNGAGH
jgi:cellulose biosynthesis protein BcsQ